MRIGARQVKLHIAFLLALACSAALGAPMELVGEAQRLLQSGKAQDAYASLKGDEDRYLGEAQFDKALAQACVAVGAQNEATLAFERVLQLNPNDINARMDLAKLYQSMSNDEQAKFQLSKIQAMTSSADLMQEAQALLKVVDEKLSKRRKRPSFEPQIMARNEAMSATQPTQKLANATASEPAADLQKVIADARQAMQNGQPNAAYEILMQYEFDGSGNIEFDYLLGVAAIESGKPDKATLALERVLEVDPKFAGARIDMGRAYMLLGNTVQAQEEFNTALKQNPPDAVKRQIEGFVAEIEQRRETSKTTWSGFFGISLGRDSNVNSATADAEPYIPSFEHTVTLDSNSVETPSNFLSLAGRIQVNYQATENVGFYAGLDLDLQRNFQASQFDRSGTDLRLGSVISVDKHQLELSLVIGKTYLEQSHYRSLSGGAIQWRFNLDARNQLQSVLQFNRLQYPRHEASVFDTDQTVLGFNWLHAFGAKNQLLGYGGLYAGKETDRNGNPSGAKDFYGVRFGGQWGIGNKWALFSSAGLLLNDYDRFDLSQQKIRDDKRFDFTVGANYLLLDSWSLRPQFNYTRNDSNIGLYGFSRNEIFVTLRRDWR